MKNLAKSVPDLSKLEALDGSNYKRWSLRLLIFLEHLEIDHVLFEDPPVRTTGIPASSSETSVDTRDKEPSTLITETQKYEKDNHTARLPSEQPHLRSSGTQQVRKIHLGDFVKEIWRRRCWKEEICCGDLA